jgi:DNA modification methylase
VTVRVLRGDCRELMSTLSPECVHCVATSPPYFRQRDYGVVGQIGREATPVAFVSEIVGVFKKVRRVLRDDGTVWLNLGDSRQKQSLIGIPWMVALAMQADGWLLRQDIIWHKIRPMPDGATTRPSVAHEYLFLFSKTDDYYYDADAIKEAASPNSHGGKKPNPGAKALETGNHTGGSLGLVRSDGFRNRRSVWSIVGTTFPGAHCAPFPPELIEPCILAGSPKGGVVLDPFAGSGTTGVVANRQGRDAILIELNDDFASIAERRLHDDAGLFAAWIEEKRNSADEGDGLGSGYRELL